MTDERAPIRFNKIEQTGEPEEPEEPEAIEINLGVLDSLYKEMSAAALAVDDLEPEPRREQMKAEAWTLCQVQVATTVRQAKADSYGHFINFFRNFPESIPQPVEDDESDASEDTGEEE
jgi:hypothetical protein